MVEKRKYEIGILKELQKYVDSKLNKMKDADKRNSAIVHLYGVSLAAAMIAKKKGLIRKLLQWLRCCMIFMHIRRGITMTMRIKVRTDLAREILGELKLTDDAEKELICSAIYHHSDKLITNNPIDKVLKDADVIHHCMNDLLKAINENEQAQFEKLCAEFGM